jgi:hypothetical protein
MTTYKLFTDYVEESAAPAKGKSPPKQKVPTAKAASPWDSFSEALQNYIAELGREYVTVVVTGSPSIVAVPGGAGRYLVCQAIMCSDKLL